MSKTSAKKSRPKVVFVIRALVQNEKNEVLLIQRSKNDSYLPNKWKLPGGKLDIGQDILNALEREVLEETGLVVLPVDKIAYWHSEILTSGKYKGLPYIVLVGIAKSIGGKVTLSNEHDDFFWAPKKEILQYDLVQETRVALTVLNRKSS